MAGFDPKRWWRSLRAKIALLLIAAAAMAAASGGLLVHGLDRADYLVGQIQSAQSRLEHYLLLAGRISDFGQAAIALETTGRRDRLDEAARQIAAVFDRIEALNRAEVAAVSGNDEKTAAATKSIGIARMMAQFAAAHRMIGQLADGGGGAGRVQPRLDAFGVTFTPLLAQALEDERQTAARARAAMTAMQRRLVGIEAMLIGGGLALALALYLLIGRPLLSRIAETVAGARALSAGRMDTRLEPRGRDELTLLMVRFNRMAAKLARREGRLLDAQASLQSTIERQTEDLRHANRRLEQIDANRRRFFSDISHELRTPLTVIQGEAEFNLKPGGKVGARQMRQAFATILARTRSLRRRVDDLLRVARSESGRLELDRTVFDLRAVAAEACEAEQPAAQRRAMTLELSAGDEPCPVRGDRDWLRQVLSGLIGNAVKYAAEATAIRFTVEREDGQAVAAVRDRGPGIAQADLERVFARFERGSQLDRTPSGGFGIGLSLARWVVSEHGGTIAMANNDDGGATVRIALPLADAAETEAERA